jgi:hypothetical protein
MLSMLAAVAEMKRDLIVERPQGQRARAKEEGKMLCTPSKTPPAQRKAMAEGHASKQSVSALVKLYGVSRATVLSVVKPRPTMIVVAQYPSWCLGASRMAWFWPVPALPACRPRRLCGRSPYRSCTGASFIKTAYSFARTNPIPM